jgi:hypothetical protein
MSFSALGFRYSFQFVVVLSLSPSLGLPEFRIDQLTHFDPGEESISGSRGRERKRGKEMEGRKGEGWGRERERGRESEGRERGDRGGREKEIMKSERKIVRRCNLPHPDTPPTHTYNTTHTTPSSHSPHDLHRLADAPL